MHAHKCAFRQAWVEASFTTLGWWVHLHTGLEPNLTCSRHEILNSKETWNSIIYHLIAIRLILLILWLVTETGFFIDRFLTQAWVMFYYLRYCACLFLKAVLWCLCIQPFFFFFFLVAISSHHCIASHIPSASYHTRVGGNVRDWKWTHSKLLSFLQQVCKANRLEKEKPVLLLLLWIKRFQSPSLTISIYRKARLQECLHTSSQWTPQSGISNSSFAPMLIKALVIPRLASENFVVMSIKWNFKFP